MLFEAFLISQRKIVIPGWSLLIYQGKDGQTKQLWVPINFEYNKEIQPNRQLSDGKYRLEQNRFYIDNGITSKFNKKKLFCFRICLFPSYLNL
jgi:hypothetical protein